MEKRKVKKRTLRYIACLEKLFLQEDLAAVLEQFSGLEVQPEGPETHRLSGWSELFHVTHSSRLCAL